MRRLGRRGFLAGLGSGLAALSASSTVGGAAEEAAGFDPTRHGFGFPNWSSSEAAYPEHDHVAVAPESVEARIRREWREAFPEVFGLALSDMPSALVGLVSRQLSVSVNQLSASNGHCYGMAYAAQEYFENPDELPRGVNTAAEVPNPEIPLGSEEGPIGDLIDRYQVTQLLDLHAWLGRRRMFRPATIDYDAELAAIDAVVAEFGTAGVTLVDSATRASHQVLVYDCQTTGAETTLAIYDPNYPARSYRGSRRTLAVSPTGDRPVSGYAEYDALVFNRWERAIRAGSAVVEPARADGRDDFRNLVSRVVRLTVDSPDVSLAAVDPAGAPVGRTTAAHMDRGRTDVTATRYRYDAPTGDYRIALVGSADTDYDLRVEVAGLGGAAFDDVVSRSLPSGAVHEYRLSVPEEGDPSLERVGDDALASVTDLDPTSVAVGAVGGAALAFLATR